MTSANHSIDTKKSFIRYINKFSVLRYSFDISTIQSTPFGITGKSRFWYSEYIDYQYLYHSQFASSSTDNGASSNGTRRVDNVRGQFETGYDYYGARYYWSELLTGWLSVDPMMDKYPSLSPYNYCAWNPVKFVDPDGRIIDSTTVPDMIWELVNPTHECYNAEFAEVFNQLANDQTTIFCFEEWNTPIIEGNAEIQGKFFLNESRKDQMDKTTIGFYWGGEFPERNLFEEVYHAKQFLDGEFGFGRSWSGGEWGMMGFDMHDEEDAHKWADRVSKSPNSWTQDAIDYYKETRKLPTTRRNVTQHYMYYDGIERTTPPNYDANGVYKDVGYRTMRKPKN